MKKKTDTEPLLAKISQLESSIIELESSNKLQSAKLNELQKEQSTHRMNIELGVESKFDAKMIEDTKQTIIAQKVLIKAKQAATVELQRQLQSIVNESKAKEAASLISEFLPLANNIKDIIVQMDNLQQTRPDLKPLERIFQLV